MENENNRFIAILLDNGIEITELSSHEEEAYRQKWFKRVVPVDKQQKAINCYCFDKDGYTGYLWHIFSYEIMDCVMGNEAKNAFDNTVKLEAILLANWGDIASCKLMNISKITAEMIDLLDDVILTDCNFEWTYAKTHESSCGPYFHSIRRA